MAAFVLGPVKVRGVNVRGGGPYFVQVTCKPWVAQKREYYKRQKENLQRPFTHRKGIIDRQKKNSTKSN
jgi:hypothetical protein